MPTRSQPNETFLYNAGLPEACPDDLRVFKDEVDAALAAPLFITSGAVWTASDVLAGEVAGKHLSTGYDAANSIAYIRSVNSATAFTNLHLAGSQTSLWSAIGAGDVLETLTAKDGMVNIGRGTYVHPITIGGFAAPTGLGVSEGSLGTPSSSVNPVVSFSKIANFGTRGTGVGIHVTAGAGAGTEGFEALSIYAQSSRALTSSMLGLHSTVILDQVGDTANHFALWGDAASLVREGGVVAQELNIQNLIAAVVIGATNANPIVIQVNQAYNFQTGDRVIISGVLGNTAANGSWIVTRIDASHVSIPVAGNGTYTSGGTVFCAAGGGWADGLSGPTMYGQTIASVGNHRTTGAIAIASQGAESKFYTGIEIQPESIDPTTAHAIVIPNSTRLDSFNAASDGYLPLIGATASNMVLVGNNLYVDPTNLRVGVGAAPGANQKFVVSSGRSFFLAASEVLSLNIGRSDIAGGYWLGISDDSTAGVNHLVFSNNAGTETVRIDSVGNTIPGANYAQNFGALDKKWLAIYGAELWVETLVAQNTIATIGGRILVGPTTSLTSDLLAADTSIVVKHNQMVSGDRVYLEANGKVEFMAITSAPSGVGPYTYTVTRDLDGSGANDWFAGDAVFNTGQTGSGFIDIYSVRGVKAGTELGPTIVGNTRNSSTVTDWSTAWAIGNLDGKYGYSGTAMGAAFGKYIAGVPHITIDATNGYRTFSGLSTVVGQWDASANFKLGPDVTAAATTKFFISNASQTYNGEAGFLAGDLLIGDNTVASNLGNLKLTAAGAIKIRRGVTDYITIDSTSMELTNVLNLKGTASAISIGVLPPLSVSHGLGFWQDRTGMYWMTGSVQGEESEISGTITGSGNVTVIVTAALMVGSPKTLDVPVVAGDSPTVVTGKIRAALIADPVIAAFFTAPVVFADRVNIDALRPAANDATMNLSVDNGTCTGLVPALVSTNRFGGSHTIQSSINTATGDYTGAGGVIKITNTGMAILGSSASKTAKNSLKFYDSSGATLLSSLYALSSTGEFWITTEDAGVTKLMLAAPTVRIRELTSSKEIVFSTAGLSVDTGAGFAGNVTISNTAPSLVLTDTTGSAKSLTIAVDANLAQFRESAGASGSLMVLDLSTNFVGIGALTPAGVINVAHNWPSVLSTNLTATFDAYGDAARFVIRRATGTAAFPSQVLIGEALGNIQFRGYHSGAAFGTVGAVALTAIAEESFTSTAQGTRLGIFTVPVGSVTQAERVRITSLGSVILAMAGALVTTATDGFTYIATCAGTPTGTPTAFTGCVPMVFDTTGVKFWIYTGGAWKGVVVA